MSRKGEKREKRTRRSANLQEGSHLRLACPEERLDGLAIRDVKLHLDCRDKLLPILRALPPLYADDFLRRELLALVGKAVHGDTSRKHGRRGRNYWEITVLAAARRGCNLDYDKLQDLAENQRRLRHILGLGDWQDEVDLDWRRMEDNLNKLRPATLQKINALVVKAGHVLEPEALASVRGDTFVVETNIHYPTASSVSGDGLRQLVNLAVELAAAKDLAGWRQAKHMLKKVRGLVRTMGRASRAQGRGTERLQPGSQKWLALAADLLKRARQLLRSWRFQSDAAAFTLDQVKNGPAPVTTPAAEWLGFIVLTEKVCDNAYRRVLEGETLANAEKSHRLFEPHTALLKRGQQPKPIEFGHQVLVIEDAAGFVVDDRVVDWRSRQKMDQACRPSGESLARADRKRLVAPQDSKKRNGRSRCGAGHQPSMRVTK